MSETQTLQQALTQIQEAAQSQSPNPAPSTTEPASTNADEHATSTTAPVQEIETLSSYIQRLPKRQMRNDKGQLQCFVELAWLLYVNGEEDIARHITEPLITVPFENSYDYWTWLEHAHVLHAVLAPAEQADTAKQQAIAAIESAVNTGKPDVVEIKRKVHQRFLEGDMVQPNDLERHISADDPAGEANRRLIHLMRLSKLELLGGSEQYPALHAADEAKQQIERIRDIIADIGLFKLIPFR
ncbi:DUF6707 family protein [Paenibacillus sp. WLX1005]|uniref:DUF6707 family protein n=1 Tax=Paenibacillus sp. WLX1005 TaxID=3243766 RepID=UPI0039844A78